MTAGLRFLVVAGALLAASAASAASEFDDFRIPDHRWRSHALRFDGNLSGVDLGATDYETSAAQGSGLVGGNLEWSRDSDLRSHFLRVRADVRGASEASDLARFEDLSYAGAGPWFRTENLERRLRLVTEQLGVSGSWRASPRRIPAWTIVASASADASFGQQWTHDAEDIADLAVGVSSRTIRDDDREIWRYDYLASGSLSVGRGRVRDATGVEQARLLVDRLRDDGRLERDPSPGVIQRLAGLFYAERGYAAPHDFPERFFWRDVERLLREDGAIGERGLDAFEVLHALQPLVVAGGRFRRPAGWFAGPTLSYRHVHRILRFDQRSHLRAYAADTLAFEAVSQGASRFSDSEDVALAGGTVEWHRPLGRRTQLDFLTTAAFDVKGANVERSWVTDLRAGHLVDERWFGWLSASHERLLGDRDGGADSWGASVGGGVRYYLEDRWNVGLEWFHRQQEVARPGAPHGDFTRAQVLRLGIGLDGGAFDAPGLVAPVRPLN